MPSYEQDMDERYEAQREEWVAERTAQYLAEQSAHPSSAVGLAIAQRIARRLPRLTVPALLLRDRGEEFDAMVADHEAAEARQATISAAGTMFTSEALPGRPSAFYSSDGRYWSNDEDARRAQLDLDTAAERLAARRRLRKALVALAEIERITVPTLRRVG